MAQFYFSAKIEDGWTLCLAPLSDRLLADIGEEISDTSGYFLFERRTLGEREHIDIIAHVYTDDAALRLSAMMGLS